MQDAGIGATGDDGRVGVSVGAALAEFVSSVRLQARIRPCRGWQARMARAWPALAMSAERCWMSASAASLIRRMAVEFGTQVVDGTRCPLAGPGLGADFVEGLGDACYPTRHRRGRWHATGCRGRRGIRPASCRVVRWGRRHRSRRPPWRLSGHSGSRPRFPALHAFRGRRGWISASCHRSAQRPLPVPGKPVRYQK